MRWIGRGTLVWGTLLVPQVLGAQTVHGTITNAVSGYPVAAVAVTLVDSANVALVRATSDSAGRFLLRAPRPGTYRVRFLVPGYQATVSQPVRVAQGGDVALSPRLRPLTAFALDTVVVRGERVPRYLEDFYERRGRGFGTFLTQQDIAKHWLPHVSDVTHWLPGFTLMYDRMGHRKVTNSRFYGLCPPVVFVDGVHVGNTDQYDLDLLNPEQIVGVESYPSVALTPLVFDVPDATCGVIAIWTEH
jgi:hypothetical protein